MVIVLILIGQRECICNEKNQLTHQPDLNRMPAPPTTTPMTAAIPDTPILLTAFLLSNLIVSKTNLTLGCINSAHQLSVGET